MAERLLVIDASLTTRLGTELKNRGRNAATVAEVASKELKDPELLPKLAVDLADREWVLVTGDDAMPDAHADIISAYRLTIATLVPWDDRKHALNQESYKREVVHRWAHVMAVQREATIRRYFLTTHRLWTPRVGRT